jgi:hypothetical protein
MPKTDWLDCQIPWFLLVHTSYELTPAKYMHAGFLANATTLLVQLDTKGFANTRCVCAPGARTPLFFLDGFGHLLACALALRPALLIATHGTRCQLLQAGQQWPWCVGYSNCCPPLQARQSMAIVHWAQQLLPAATYAPSMTSTALRWLPLPQRSEPPLAVIRHAVGPALLHESAWLSSALTTPLTVISHQHAMFIYSRLWAMLDVCRLCAMIAMSRLWATAACQFFPL